jgi:hypothetical protein
MFSWSLEILRACPQQNFFQFLVLKNLDPDLYTINLDPDCNPLANNLSLKDLYNCAHNKMFDFCIIFLLILFAFLVL